jgi:hypothetical protein
MKANDPQMLVLPPRARGAKGFLKHVAQTARYWAELPNRTPLEVAEGVAFSILVALDGEALACGPYAVRPINQRGKEGRDIAGSLHERFHDVAVRMAAELMGRERSPSAPGKTPRPGTPGGRSIPSAKSAKSADHPSSASADPLP